MTTRQINKSMDMIKLGNIDLSLNYICTLSKNIVISGLCFCRISQCHFNSSKSRLIDKLTVNFIIVVILK